MQQAADENRAMTTTEKATIETAVNEAKGLKARLDRAGGDASMMAVINGLTAGMTSGPTPPGRGGSPGEEFLRSEAGRWLLTNKHTLPTGQWTSPSSEIMAATVTSDSASGGALIIPDHQPGIVPTATRPLVLASLIAPGVTDSNLIAFMRETAFINAAAAVAEGATKPESTLTFTAATTPVKKIAHWIPVTDEMLEDSGAFRSYLDVRMRHGVDLAEDDQLLNGSGVGANTLGFLATPGLATAIARGTDTNADAVLRQIAAIFVSTSLQPTAIIMNPANFLTIQMLKSAAGEYISGLTPFNAPQPATLWGLPVALTSAIAPGTALVGCFRTAAQLFRKGGVRVEASNSHASFFITNLVAIRAETRVALAIYRPAAFGVVTGLN